MFDTVELPEVVATREELRTMAPGPFLGILLTGLTPVSGEDHVAVLQHHARQVAYHQAQMYRTMAHITELMRDETDDHPTMAGEFAAAEIRVALNLTRRAADTELAMALELAERLPEVLQALMSGKIDRRRAGAIVHNTTHLPVATARQVVAEVIEDAAHWTTGQLIARLRRLGVEADPDDAKERYGEALRQRHVSMSANPSGTAELHGHDLPPARVAAARDRVNHIAKTLHGDVAETRTMDQLRADVMLDLLAGRDLPGATRRGVVDLTVDVGTLAGLSADPGELGGYGPVVADVARQIADESHDAEWRWTLIDRRTGEMAANGITQRRPTAAQRRAVTARHRRCVFPGCRNPAVTSDIDHTVPYSESGFTSVDQLAPLCRHDHRIRHQAGWTYTQLPNGDHVWTSRLGQTFSNPVRAP